MPSSLRTCSSRCPGPFLSPPGPAIPTQTPAAPTAAPVPAAPSSSVPRLAVTPCAAGSPALAASRDRGGAGAERRGLWVPSARRAPSVTSELGPGAEGLRPGTRRPAPGRAHRPGEAARGRDRTPTPRGGQQGPRRGRGAGDRVGGGVPRLRAAPRTDALRATRDPPAPGVPASRGGPAPVAPPRVRAAMAGPGARWKRHIVRQLRQRDRTQKALFLELVPACECAPGLARGPRRGPAGGGGEAGSRAAARAQKSLLAPLYAPPSLVGPFPGRALPGSAWSPFPGGRGSLRGSRPPRPSGPVSPGWAGVRQPVLFL